MLDSDRFSAALSKTGARRMLNDCVCHMQTETPAQLAVRNEERRKNKLPKVHASFLSAISPVRDPCLEHRTRPAAWARCSWRRARSVRGGGDSCVANSECVETLMQASVVSRDMVAVVTRGTMTDSEMLTTHPDACFFLALAEAPAPMPATDVNTTSAADGSAGRPEGGDAGAGGAETGGGAQAGGRGSGEAQVLLGACAVDVATGQMLIGQWCARPGGCLLASS